MSKIKCRIGMEVMKIVFHCILEIFHSILASSQARRQRGGGGGGGAGGYFFLAPPRYFFGRKKLVFLGGKNVKICDLGQKNPSDFVEDLFVFVFLEITCFWSENL